MLTELEALVSDDTSSLIDDEGLARRWGSAAGLLDLAAQHGISQRVMKHLFVRLDDEPEPFPLLQFIAENEDSPDVVEQFFRAGLRNPTVVPICAELSRTIELVDYALHPGTEPQCYCGNSAKQKGFSGCTRHGYPRLNARGYLYCLSCLRFFDRKEGRILGFVERCIVMESVACRCGERIPKDPKPWARDRSAVECEHCGRKIHLNTGLVVGMVGMIARPKDSRK